MSDKEELSHMESKREYKDTPAPDIKLPREVYYRCLWTVRDFRRIRELASAVPGIPMKETPDLKIVSGNVIRKAASDLSMIRRALESVPEEYQTGILENIINKEPFGDNAHPNTWKRWKLVFLYELARGLDLI